MNVFKIQFAFLISMRLIIFNFYKNYNFLDTFGGQRLLAYSKYLPARLPKIIFLNILDIFFIISEFV